ncbi:hypothetical protein ACIHEI_06420 [Kitasatospora sp. NPDC051984]|uniref:hypothetical protein n=1 Tax=Kitasatospora sp. NPDC051984 TaxID=3364059 RepID=UPI0037C56CEE
MFDPDLGRIRTTAIDDNFRNLVAPPGGTATRLYHLRFGLPASVGTKSFETDNVIPPWSPSAQQPFANVGAINKDGTTLYLTSVPAGVAAVKLADGEVKTYETPGEPTPFRPTIAAGSSGRFHLGNEGNATGGNRTPAVCAFEPAAGPIAVAADKDLFTVQVLCSPDGATPGCPGTPDPLAAIDTATMTITARGTGPAPAAAAVAPDGKALYALHADGRGTVLDPTGLEQTGTFTALPDSAPVLAVGPDGTLCIAHSSRKCTTVAPGADATSALVPLGGVPVAVLAAAATEAAPSPSPSGSGSSSGRGAAGNTSTTRSATP